MAARSEQGSHFWIMTFLALGASGLEAKERVGHWTPAPGMTRFDAMQAIHKQMIEASPSLAEAAVINFDIQLNQL